MFKDFDQWNIEKQRRHFLNQTIFFHEREIWWCSLGVNIGYEQDGKNNQFERPILIIKKFNQDLFLGLPLTTQPKQGKYYMPIKLRHNTRVIIMSQIRAWSSKRLIRKIGYVSPVEFDKILLYLVQIIKRTR